MAWDSAAFDLGIVGVIVGMVVLLYGVSLNAGQSLNAVMVVGGLIGLVSIFVMTVDTVRVGSGGH